jgi:hypothetical protein
MTHPVRPFITGLAALSFAWITTGCGDDLKARYPVSGKVTYKGQPVPKGTISFSPVDGAGEGAYGEVVAGSYRLTTYTPGDGAVPGRYRVSIASAEAVTPKAAFDTNPNATPEAAVAKAQRTAKHHIPVKYASSDASGLTAEVKATSNIVNFELVD